VTSRGIKNPAEVIKVRRQAGSVVDAKELWAEEGAGGFYVGSVANYAYSYPVDSAKFLLYEVC